MMKSKGNEPSQALASLRRMVKNDACVACNSALGKLRATTNAGQFETKCIACDWTYAFIMRNDRWSRIVSMDFIMEGQRWRAIFTGDATTFVRFESDDDELHVLPGFVSPEQFERNFCFS